MRSDIAVLCRDSRVVCGCPVSCACPFAADRHAGSSTCTTQPGVASYWPDTLSPCSRGTAARRAERSPRRRCWRDTATAAARRRCCRLRGGCCSRPRAAAAAACRKRRRSDGWQSGCQRARSSGCSVLRHLNPRRKWHLHRPQGLGYLVLGRLGVKGARARKVSFHRRKGPSTGETSC